MLAALGETRQAIEATNFALDHHQQVPAYVPGSRPDRAQYPAGPRASSAWPLEWVSSNIGAKRADGPISAPIREPEANAAPNSWPS